MSRLEVKHVELAQANEYIEKHHRHHGRLPSHRFSLGCFDGDKLVGVAIVGRPTARNINKNDVVEVKRCCVDGTKNACSALYGACRRAAKVLGYKEIITYILISEPGISLKAAGWDYRYTTKGRSWNRPGRKRIDKAPIEDKKLYGVVLDKGRQRT